MTKQKLTDSVVKRLEPPTTGLRIYRDQALRGFGVRVLPTGTRAFVLDFSTGGARHIYTLMPFTGYGGETDQARRAALLLQARIRGEEAFNPAAAKRTRRTAAAEAWTVAKIIEEFEREAERKIKRGELRENTRDQYLRYSAMLRTKFGTRLVTNISRDDLQRWHDQLSDETGPASANAAIRISHAVLAFAEDKGWVASNAAKGIKRNKQKSRERVLDKKERRLVWNGSEGIDYPYCPITRLLMLTGQRRTEISGLRWDEIDFDNMELRLPPERCKNGVSHTIPLAPMSLAILRNVPRKSSTFVFSTTGVMPSGTFSNVKRKLDQLCGVRNWCWHDLRRTFSTGMAEMGVAQETTEAILNHVSGKNSGVSAIYNRYDYKVESRRAIERWEKYLLQDEQPTIVDLNARRK